MRFTWDEAKRQANLAKHGLDFADAWQVFEDEVVMLEDDRFDYGEDRYVTIGVLRDELVSIVHTWEDDTIRLISMRKATGHERDIYITGRLD